MKHQGFQLELHSKDFVDPTDDVFCRIITIKNNGPEREIRLFTHQVFEISSGGRADTALYEPEEHYILDYKGRCSLLVYGQSAEGAQFDQFAVGNQGIEGKLGTFADAEDGELSNNAVEHGGVDSILRFSERVAAGSSAEFHYWIAAADSQFTAEKLHLKVKHDGLENRLSRTRQHWREWLHVSNEQFRNIPEEILPFVKKSLLIIKAHTDVRGGIIASCDSSIYNYGRDYYSYVWPRDGAYAMWPLIRLGYTEEPRAFFEFCRSIITTDGYVMHKYQPDKAIGSTWHPLLHNRHKELAIQEDETAIIVYMLQEYLHYSGDESFVRNMYPSFIKPAATFMQRFIDEQTHLPHASYDLWEEKFLTTTYTTSLVSAALHAAADMAGQFGDHKDSESWRATAQMIDEGAGVFFDSNSGHYRKGYYLESDGSLTFDNTLDLSSFYGPMMYRYGKSRDEHVGNSVHRIEEQLSYISPSGGTARYKNDAYFRSTPPYKGNPWFVTTLWLAQYYIRVKQYEKAEAILQWSLDHALPSGALSEQVHPETGQHVGVTPLVWSHAELINTVLDMSKAKNRS
jgi:GH15 family glucan-1,4-alpha-glucosidase